jgi:hypothetical protein
MPAAMVKPDAWVVTVVPHDEVGREAARHRVVAAVGWTTVLPAPLSLMWVRLQQERAVERSARWAEQAVEKQAQRWQTPAVVRGRLHSMTMLPMATQ